MKFVTYHIGARDGTREFPSISTFDKDIYSVLFDGDSNCIDKIREASNHSSREEVHSFVISGKEGSAEFFHTKSPYATSLFERHDGIEDWNLFWVDHDYIIKEALALDRIEKVSTRTLDSLRLQELSKTPPPDFISLDTQGSELDILQGAVDSLNASVVACVAEVEFHKLYKNQPLFGDILTFLADKGFWFVGFDHILDLAPYRAPVGLRGRGFHLTCNALFLKQPDMAARVDPRMLVKLAFCSIIYGCFEVAWKCFDNPAFQLPKGDQSKSSIIEFLSSVIDAYKRHPKLYPYGFNERAIHGEPAKGIPSVNETEIEGIFNKWGLQTQAQILKDNRLKHEACVNKGPVKSVFKFWR